MERVIDRVRYRIVPESDFWLAGDDGTIWKGELFGSKAEWRQVKAVPHGKTGILYVKIGEGPFLISRRAAEKILAAFGKPKTKQKKYIQYRDGNPHNLRLENLYWSSFQFKPKVKSIPKKKPIGRGAYAGNGVKVIPLTWGNETQVERNHASQDHRTANPPHHLPDR